MGEMMRTPQRFLRVALAAATTGLILAALFASVDTRTVDAAFSVNCPSDDLQVAINQAASGARLRISGIALATSLSREPQPRRAPRFDAPRQQRHGSHDRSRCQGQNLQPHHHRWKRHARRRHSHAGILTLERAVSVTGNHAFGSDGDDGTRGGGGGIFNSGAIAMRSDSAVSHNSAFGPQGLGGIAGGIYNVGNVTLSDRSSVVAIPASSLVAWPTKECSSSTIVLQCRIIARSTGQPAVFTTPMTWSSTIMLLSPGTRRASARGVSQGAGSTVLAT